MAALAKVHADLACAAPGESSPVAVLAGCPTFANDARRGRPCIDMRHRLRRLRSMCSLGDPGGLTRAVCPRARPITIGHVAKTKY